MKRNAETQLVKGDDSDDPEEVVQESSPFKRADESVLATRKIRALPKRSMPGTVNGTGVTSSQTLSTPKFAGFAGFGISPPKSDSFSFTQSNQTSNAEFQSQTAPLTSPPPAVAPSASSATKTFASFLGPPAFSSAPPPAASTSDAKRPDAHALKFYTSLRGLNVSFLSAISTSLEQDPFSDVSSLLERYKELRIAVQKDFDEKTGDAKDKTSPIASDTATSSTSDKVPAVAPTPPSSMPVPPASFAGFGTIASSTSLSSGSMSAGFTPKPDSMTSAKTSTFSFPSAISSSAPAAKSSTSSAIPPPIRAFDFAKPPQVSPPPPAPVNASFNFTLPTSSSSASVGTTSSTEEDSAGSKSSLLSTSSSTNSLFGPSPSPSVGSPFLGFGLSPSPAGKDKGINANPASTPNPFGNKSDTPAVAPINLFGSTFGSSAPKPSSFGGFGKSSGSIGNPFGFAFGTASSTSTGDDTTSIFTRPSAFNFGTAPSAATTPEVVDTDGSATPLGEEDKDLMKVFQTRNHDIEGEGEEDEETTHSVRTKVFKLSTAKTNWMEMGVGVLRLKKHKEKNSRRALLRNSNTGKITINFNIYTELNPQQTGKFVSFIGHEDGDSVTFKLRFKSEEDAVALKEVLDREIALVKAKSD